MSKTKEQICEGYWLDVQSGHPVALFGPGVNAEKCTNPVAGSVKGWRFGKPSQDESLIVNTETKLCVAHLDAYADAESDGLAEAAGS